MIEVGRYRTRSDVRIRGSGSLCKDLDTQGSTRLGARAMSPLLEEGAGGGVKLIVIAHSELRLEVGVCGSTECHDELEKETFYSLRRWPAG